MAISWLDDKAHVLHVESTDGNFDAYLSRPSAQVAPVIIVLHEVFGVNADLRATCNELTSAGFIAVCPDLFWRRQRGVDLSVRSESDWQQGLALYTAYDIDAGVRDIGATIAVARELSGASGKVGVLGFCLGGLLTFLSATRTRIDAAVAFHGGRTDEFLNEAASLDAPLQMHLAEEDEFIPKDAQRRIVAALAANPLVEIHSYPGCRHAFSRHDGAHFDAAAAHLARLRTQQFFVRHLIESSR